MQNGLSAREERVFAEMVRDLEPASPRVRAWHIAALCAGWIVSWIAFVSSIETLALAFGCFVVVATLTAAIGWGVLEATTRTPTWDRSQRAIDKMRTCWRNLST